MKGQAALEFLSTYVLAFLGITIALGGLYYFGVFDFSKYLPQKCLFPTQMKCIDFSLKTDKLNLKLVNGLGEDISVTSILLKDDSLNPVSCSGMPSPFVWVADTEVDISFTGCSRGSYVPGERVNLKVELNYFAPSTPSQPNHVINGKINGRIS